MEARHRDSELRRAWALDITCENCGRVRRFQRRKILDLEARGYRSFHELGSRLYCRGCDERDAASRNIKIIPHLYNQKPEKLS